MRRHVLEPEAPACPGSGMDAKPGTTERRDGIAAVQQQPVKKATRRRRRSKSGRIVVVPSGLPGLGKRR